MRSRPEIIVTLSDASGKVLGTAEAYTVPSIVRPNSVIPYKALIDNPPEAWDKVEVIANADEFGGFDTAFYYPDLETSQTSVVLPANEYEGVKIVGRVKNTGKKSATLVSIVGVVYDAAGNVVDVNNTYASLDKIAPGQESPFELDFRQAKSADKYELFASASPSE